MISGAFAQAALESLLLLAPDGLVMSLLEGFLDAVDLLAVGALLGVGDFLDVVDRLLDFAVVAEVFRVPGAQGGLVGAGLQLGQRPLFEVG